jgi:hypothetical protein
MSILRLAGSLLLLLFVASHADAHDKHYQEQWIKKLDGLSQNFLLLHDVGSIKRNEKLEFAKFKHEDIDAFLKMKFGDMYSGFHPDIAHYVQVISNRPKYQLQLWFAAIKKHKKELQNEKLNSNITILLYSRFEFPQLSFDDDWILPNILSLKYGNAVDDYTDDRLNFLKNYTYRKAHFNSLRERNNKPVHALAMSVLGSATITRIPHFSEKTYWDLYPMINHTQRDFYAVMLASAFVLNELEKLDSETKPFVSFSLTEKHQFVPIVSNFSMNLEFLAEHFDFNKNMIHLMNRVYFKQIVPAKRAFIFPKTHAKKLEEKDLEIALKSAYFTHKIRAPHCLVAYKFKEHDQLERLAQYFSTNEREIIKLNHLINSEVAKNQTVFIKVPQIDSVFYSALNNLSTSEIEELLKKRAETIPEKPAPTNVTTAAPKTHIVKSGETLSHISRKYGVSVKQIKDWNNLKSDNIQIGQKLIIKK